MTSPADELSATASENASSSWFIGGPNSAPRAGPDVARHRDHLGRSFPSTAITRGALPAYFELITILEASDAHVVGTVVDAAHRNPFGQGRPDGWCTQTWRPCCSQATAEERIAAASKQLTVLDSIAKSAGTIPKSAVTIEGSCTKVAAGIRRLLDEALSALSGLGGAAGNGVSAVGSTSGVA